MSYQDFPEPEITARQKYACPACGAEATWNPARQMLVCEFCGTDSPAEITEDGPIRERSLVDVLAELGEDARGWMAPKRSVKCQSCQAISVMDPAKVGQRCEFCGSAQLIPFEEQQAPIRPESLLPFRLDQANVRERIRAWYGSHWLAPGKLKHGAMTDTLHGIYIPYWTFDARAESSWTAEAGYYYWESESYTDSNGNRQTRQVRKTRWKHASGHVSHFFDDALVPASAGVPAKYILKIEPFPTTTDLVPYDAGYLSGWTVEHYQLDLMSAAQSAHKRMSDYMHSLCARDVPGDTHRGLRVNTEYLNQTFKHVLLPVWILHYDYGRRRYQVVINGYTGKIAGGYPISVWKVLALILLALFVALVLFGLYTISGSS